MGIRNVRARRMHWKARELWRAGHTDRAKKLALDALDLLTTVESDSLARVADQVSILETLAQFASDLAEHAEARRRCDEAVALLEQPGSDGARDDWFVGILVQKGNSQRLSAMYDESALTLAHALALAERAPGSPLLRVGPLNALGILAKDRGLYKDAEIYYSTALELITSQAGTDVPELASIYHNLAGLAHIQGKFGQAEEPARQAIRLRQAATPPDSAGLAADLSVLGAVLAGQERFDEAAANFSEALGLWRSRYGNRHYEVAVQLNNLAAIQQAQGNHALAESSFREAMAIKREILGDSHPEIAVILNNLATVYADVGRRPEARECYDQAVEIFARTLGTGHPSTLACIQNRAHLR